MNSHPSAPTALPHLALVRVSGADARSFLDAQLTRNVPAPGTASLAGYCSPKGRLLAILVVWSSDDAIHLVTSRDVVDALVRRLRMYVLRAKAVVEDVTATHALLGSFAEDAVPAAPWDVVADGSRFAIRVPNAHDVRRVLHVSPHVREAMSENGEAERAAGERWRWSDIVAGVPSIVAATQDRFVPQMVNLEALGGVDFKKGCFPGQEIVARSQYLGKLKRRTAIATLDIDANAEPPAPGTDVWIEGSSDPQGTVVDAARGPDGRVAMLVELPIVALAATSVRPGSPDGPRATLAPVPYPLPDNEVFVRPKL